MRQTIRGVSGHHGAGSENLQVLQGEGSENDVAFVLQSEGERLVRDRLCGQDKEESSPAETSPAAADSSAAAGGKED
jgi:hypothetical protein